MKFECPFFLENKEQKKKEREQVKSYLVQLYDKYPLIIFELDRAIKSVKRGENPRRIKSKIEGYVKREIRRKEDYLKFVKKLKKSHAFRIPYFFKEWKTKAIPILTDIIEKSGSKLEGLMFYSDIPVSTILFSSGRETHEIHVNAGGSYNLNSWDTYPESKRREKYTATGLAHKMLDGLEKLYPTFPSCYPKELDNKRRNQLVKTIEQKTGRNLKKEVMNSEKI